MSGARPEDCLYAKHILDAIGRIEAYLPGCPAHVVNVTFQKGMVQMPLRRMLHLIFPLLVLFVLNPTSAEAQKVRVTSTSPPEAKLAAIDTQSPTVSQALVNVYATLLDRLDQKCPEDRSFIGDIAVKGVQLLESEKDVKMTLLQFLAAMDKSIPAEAAGQVRCTEIAAALVTMINSN